MSTEPTKKQIAWTLFIMVTLVVNVVVSGTIWWASLDAPASHSTEKMLWFVANTAGAYWLLFGVE